VWQELAKGLMEKNPRKMIEMLRECGVLKVLLPEVDALFGVPQRADYHPEIDSGIHTLMTLQRAADMGLSLPERYAALLHDLGKAKTPPDILPRHHGHDINGVEPVREVNQRLRAPRQCAELAELVCRWHIIFHQVEKLRSKTVIDVLKKTDAFRRPERFAAALNVCIADTQGRLNREHTPYPQRAHWLALLEAANQADSGKIAAECRAQGKAHFIAEQIDRARLAQIAPLQKTFRGA
ncbi:TPA: HD domain-containing protein, partial [Neisseria gonorrhoeae]